MNEVTIAHRRIGPGQPTFVIAEAGVNHNGNLQLATELIRQAARCGADCVKFQTFKAERVVTHVSPKAAYQLKVTDPAESQFEMLRKLELSEDGHRLMIDECRKAGVIFMSTPYSIEDAEMLDALNVPGFKIASGQLVELPFLAFIARFNRPIILSTGMATEGEITEAVATVRDHGNNQLVVLQCTTNYPSSLADSNLRAMATIARLTNAVVGYSDHTEGITACVASVALGASVVEKHFTLDRKLPGPDHSSSSEPAELAQLVQQIRDVETALGSAAKEPSSAEIANTVGMRRSVVAARAILRGEKVSAQDFAFKRPATGLQPKRLGEVTGRTARRAIAMDAQVQPEDFE